MVIMLTKKLREYANMGNLYPQKCQHIADCAYAAIIEHSKTYDTMSLAEAMLRCCDVDKDEAAYFRLAVDSILEEKWGAKEQDRAVVVSLMNQVYEMAVDGLKKRPENEGKI
jgi:hypothetical protein